MRPVQPRPFRLQALPYELLVNLVYNYLEIPDVMNLRKTSKFFYSVTPDNKLRQKTLAAAGSLAWIYLDPLPPLHDLTDNGSLLTLHRARRLGEAWQAPEPKLNQWTFPAYFHVLEMLLLPGAQYLAAVVTFLDKRKNRQWALVIYVLLGSHGPKPLMYMPTNGPAYDLRAKYSCANDGTDGPPGAITLAYIGNDGWLQPEDPAVDFEAEWARDGLRSHYQKIATSWNATPVGIMVKHLEAQREHVKDIAPGTPAFNDYLKRLPRRFIHLPFISEREPLSSLDLIHLEKGSSGKIVLTVLKGSSAVLVQSLGLSKLFCRTVVFNTDSYSAKADDKAGAIIRSVRFIPETKQIAVVRQKGVSGRSTRLEGQPESALHSQQSPVETHVLLYEMSLELYKRPDENCAEGPYPSRGILGFHTHAKASSDVHVARADKKPPWLPEDVNRAPLDYLPALNVSLNRSAGESSLKRWTIFPRAPHLHVPHGVKNGAAFPPIRFYVPGMDNGQGYGPRVSFIPGAVPVQTPHLCWDGWKKDHHRTPRGQEWRLVHSSSNAGRQLLYAVSKADPPGQPRVTGFYKLYESANGNPSAVTRLPISLLEAEAKERRVSDRSRVVVAWDDSLGRMCWTFPGSTTIRVVDFVKLPRRDIRDPMPIRTLAGGTPVIAVTSPVKSSYGDVEPSQTVDTRQSKHISMLTELNFFFWDSGTL